MFAAGGRNQQPSGAVPGIAGTHRDRPRLAGDEGENPQVAERMRGHVQAHQPIARTPDERVSVSNTTDQFVG